MPNKLHFKPNTMTCLPLFWIIRISKLQHTHTWQCFIFHVHMQLFFWDCISSAFSDAKTEVQRPIYVLGIDFFYILSCIYKCLITILHTKLWSVIMIIRWIYLINFCDMTILLQHWSSNSLSHKAILDKKNILMS